MRIDLYTYKTQDFKCPCGWEGKGADLGLGEIYMDSAIVEFDCPKCFETIGSGQGNITNEKAFLSYQESKNQGEIEILKLGAEDRSVSED